MQNLRMPESYNLVSQDEMDSITGGGAVGDAVSAFLDNIHLLDVFLGSSILFVSFTFAPQLLFDAVRSVFSFAMEVTDGIQNLFGQLLGLRS